MVKKKGMFKKDTVLPAPILSCNMDSRKFTQKQETKIRKIVVTKHNKALKHLIKAADNNTSNESLLDIIMKGKNKIASKAQKTGQFFKELKATIMPSGPAIPSP
ncbi:hypothetical protein [Borreliella garinii]|uniref:hypothetical protein n=2 Tax=Borreliella garinii TaxID=29519 RepID=UPI001AEE722D|nr:hypothetical protein [Borreliella garinii]